MKKHKTFEDITKNASVQNALRDLYDHPDKVELYPGVFCESDAKMGDEYVFLSLYFRPFWYHILICKSGSRAFSVLPKNFSWLQSSTWKSIADSEINVQPWT